MNTRTRPVKPSTLTLLDAEGNEYPVTATQNEFQVESLQHGWEPWQTSPPSFHWGEEPVDRLDDGSFRVRSSGTLIYLPSRRPK